MGNPVLVPYADFRREAIDGFENLNLDIEHSAAVAAAASAEAEAQGNLEKNQRSRVELHQQCVDGEAQHENLRKRIGDALVAGTDPSKLEKQDAEIRTRIERAQNHIAGLERQAPIEALLKASAHARRARRDAYDGLANRLESEAVLLRNRLNVVSFQLDLAKRHRDALDIGVSNAEGRLQKFLSEHSIQSVAEPCSSQS